MSRTLGYQKVVAALVATKEDQEVSTPPPYLKLIADCWEHIFDHLPLRSIYAMGKTCKRMHQMAGYYFREYCSDLVYNLRGNNLIEARPFCKIRLQRDFYQFVRMIKIDEFSGLDYYLDPKLFPSLKSIIIRHNPLSGYRLCELDIECLRYLLMNIESVKLIACKFENTETFEKLVSYCPNLKYLTIRLDVAALPLREFIFQQHFPNLEKLHIQLNYWENYTPTVELKAFFEKNSTIKDFATDYHFLWANQDFFLHSKIRFNRLIIRVNSVDFDTAILSVDFLKALHGRGFYKSIHISFGDGELHEILQNSLPTLPALQTLRTHDASFVDLSRFCNLKELTMHDLMSLKVTELEALAKNLVNLQRLVLNIASYDTVLPFIRYSKKLKMLKIVRLRHRRVPMETIVLNATALNDERKRLQHACEVSVYVSERVYLYEKNNMKNISLSHINLKRPGSDCNSTYLFRDFTPIRD